jgi:hypothetical protein
LAGKDRLPVVALVIVVAPSDVDHDYDNDHDYDYDNDHDNDNDRDNDRDNACRDGCSRAGRASPAPRASGAALARRA